jgi:hypothetical protein
MSSGFLSFEGRNESSEGIDISQAVRYYSRLRFVEQLMPVLEASESARVIAILAGGQEEKLDFDDLEMKKNFKPLAAPGNGIYSTALP